MPTVTLQGFAINATTFAGTATLELTISDGATLSYATVPQGVTNLFGIDEVDIVSTGGAWASTYTLNGTDVITSENEDEVFIYQIIFLTGPVTVLQYYDSSTEIDYIIPLSGTGTIPSSPSELDTWIGLIVGVSAAASPFALGDAIDPTSVAGATVTDEDMWTGSSAAETFNGGAGNDTLDGGLGADNLNGGDGLDWVSYAGSATGVWVRLWAGAANYGDAEGDTLVAIENVVGSSGRDLLVGDNLDNVFVGGAMSDIMWAGAGDDHLVGDSGWDVLSGGVGADTLDGGSGQDYAMYRDSSAAVTVRLWSGSGQGGDAEGDVLISIENVYGSEFSDRLIGDAGDNYINGLGGSDTIWSGAGNDYIDGRSGWDALNGQAGNDTLAGGRGNDTLSGGSDADSFIFMAGDNNDVVTDFEDDLDVIDFDLVGLGYSDVADLYANATITELDGNTTFNFGVNGSLTINGISAANLIDDMI